MTRATNVLLYAVPSTILYLLFLTGVVSVPLIATETANEILPVVRRGPLSDSRPFLSTGPD